MSTDEIRHFLLTIDPETGSLHVQEFGTDYATAQEAYARAEQADIDSKLETVLISADSLATIEQTHSSYFEGSPAQLKKILAEAIPPTT
jgi:hypothetical protein